MSLKPAMTPAKYAKYTKGEAHVQVARSEQGMRLVGFGTSFDSRPFACFAGNAIPLPQ
jgi:hypothetical protein